MEHMGYRNHQTIPKQNPPKTAIQGYHPLGPAVASSAQFLDVYVPPEAKSWAPGGIRGRNKRMKKRWKHGEHMEISPWIGDFCWISDDFSMDFWLKNGDFDGDLSIYMDLSFTDMDNSEYYHDLFMIYGDFWLGMCGDWQKSKMAWDKILPSLVPFTNSRGKGSWFCVRLLRICLQYGPHQDVTGRLAVGCRENCWPYFRLDVVICLEMSYPGL